MPVVTVRDQTVFGRETHQLTVDILTERISVRELIRSRVYQEVADYNLKLQTDGSSAFRGLVQPTDAESELNGREGKRSRPVDWKAQFDKACEAFERNGFLILVDDFQPSTLDEHVTLTAESNVSFMRLVPLVGG